MFALFACVPLLAGCKRGDSARLKPIPSLADSTSAARVFEHMRAVWTRNEPRERPQLRRDLEAFTQIFPKDGLVPLARAFWILSLMDPPADWTHAERLLSAFTPPSSGATHDLYVIANAKLLRYRHEPEAAFGLLRPLVGKMVDGRARALLQEELTFDALESRQPFEAIAYMDAWLRGATEEDREASEAKVSLALGAVPESALRGSLSDMRASAKRGESHGYGIAIERLVAERLGQIAVERGDAALARWLLDPTAGGHPLGEEAVGALGRLATSKRGVGSVAGRTVGLVLPTSSPELRDEAADVLRGVLWALDLIPAPGHVPPREEAIRLVTRDDGGDAARLRISLEEVAGEGAGVIVTALDPDAAEEALDWGVTSSLTVVALAAPRSRADAGPPRAGFTVGEDWSAELAVLEGALGARVAHRPLVLAPLADREDAPSLTASLPSSTDRGVSWLPPTACDAAPSAAGESGFPLGAWEKASVEGWVVAGSPTCADDLLRGLGGRSRRGVVGLSLEASESTFTPPKGLRVVAVGAGVVPIAAAPPGDPRVADVKAMVSRTGSPSRWWTALGHDAAVLARRALAALPDDTTADLDEIARRRAAVRRGLYDARAPLWSSEEEGFDGRGILPRTLRVVDLER